jgi:hypothetical protein
LTRPYQQRLYSIKFDRLYEEGIGQPLFRHFKKVVRDSNLYDYVLIDSRTGLSDEGSICTRDLADHLVVLTGLNRQNVEGTVRFLRQLKAGDWAEGRIIFVASPVPVHYEELREQRMKEARRVIKQSGFDPDLKLHIPTTRACRSTRSRSFITGPARTLFQAYESLQGELRRVAKDTPLDWQQQAFKAIRDNQFEDALRLIRELTVEAPALANSVLGWLTGCRWMRVRSSRHKRNGSLISGLLLLKIRPVFINDTHIYLIHRDILIWHYKN